MGCGGSSPEGNSNIPELPTQTVKQIEKNPFLAKYEVGKQLGKGAYASVYLCTNRETGVRAAVKIVERDSLEQDDLNGLYQEVAIMRQLNHPNIVQLLDFYEDSEKFHLVIELMEGGELFERLSKRGTYSEKEARDVVRTLVDALRYCHERNVVHRDLKPENLLLESKDNDAQLKLADFGFAIRESNKGNNLKTQCGSPYFIAPEILTADDEGYGRMCDMWSVGVITYYLLAGVLPFNEPTQKVLFRKIKTAEFSFPDAQWANVSAEAKDLIRKLLVVDPNKRLTADQALYHPWIMKDEYVLSARSLSRNLNDLKKTQSHIGNTKFRGAVSAVLLMNRLNRMVGKPPLTSNLRVESIKDSSIVIRPEDVEDDHVTIEHRKLNESSVILRIDDTATYDNQDRQVLQMDHSAGI